MSEIGHNGGPAFPHTRVLGAGWGEEYPGGLTKRDWFAGQALAGIVAGARGLEMSHEDFAIHAYAIADAMLAEREVGD